MPDDLAETATDHESTTKPTASVSPPKQTLGRYEIESMIGAGGMGLVYAAFDPELQRRVAVKVLPDAKRSQTARERLLREARAMARLTHPNVVRVYEVDSIDGHDFVAMELVDGENLADWLRAAKHTRDEIIAKFVAAGHGLEAAHAAGVAHRDFKPHNVLCAKDGRILVTDFGLAREIESTATESGGTSGDVPTRNTPLNEITQAGSVVGTPAYMAPEQRTGGQVGPAADQFSFCVALWEALTGARPYRGNPEEIVKAYERGPEALDASPLPRRLRAPLLRGLAIDPAKRWPSISALLRQLTKRSRRMTAAVLAIATASIGVAAGLLIASRDHTPPCTAPVFEPASVWSPITSTVFVANQRRGIARMIDRDLATWRDARAHACRAEPKVREAQLACLDGVLARIEVVVQTSQAANGSIDPEDLIEPSVCTTAQPPPRLPRTISAEFRDVLTEISRTGAKHARLSQTQLAELDTRAKSEPCARALVQFGRAKYAEQAPDFTKAMREAELLAEQCGDDHLYAALVVYGAMADESDTAKDHAQRARTAVSRVPTTDLQAKLDLLSMFEAVRDKKLDEAITRAESAVTKLEKRGCIVCTNQAAVFLIDLMWQRGRSSDFERIPHLFDHHRTLALAELGADAPQMRAFEGFRARWLLRNDQLDEGHAILDAIHHETPIDKPRQVHVRVVDDTGHPVSGATVTAGYGVVGDSRRAGFALDDGAQVRAGKTNERGELELAVAADAVVIAELADRRSLAVPADDPVTVVLEPTSRVTGKVALNGIEPRTVVIQAFDPTASVNARYQLLAAVRRDGTFELAGVPRRRLAIRAALGDLAGSSGSSVTIDVNKPVIEGIELSVGGAQRTIHVLVRSTVGLPVPAAIVSIYPGEVASSNAAAMSERTDATASAIASKVERSKLPAEAQALARNDDLFVTIAHAPTGPASACAMGYPRLDEMDDHTREQARTHSERVEVRCVPIAETAKVVVVEVPPFPRFD